MMKICDLPSYHCLSLVILISPFPHTLTNMHSAICLLIELLFDSILFSFLVVSTYFNFQLFKEYIDSILFSLLVVSTYFTFQLFMEYIPRLCYFSWIMLI